MKKHLLIVGICVILSACGSGGGGFLSPSPDPGAAHNFTYHFDENSGTVAVNSDGDGYFDGILYGASWVPGKTGSALQFGSTLGSRVEIPMLSSDASTWYEIPFDNSINIGAWIKFDNMPTSESYHIVGSGYYGIKSFRLQINVSGQVEFLLREGTAWHTIIISDQMLTQGTWYYVAVTYDETTGRIYIDGVEDNSSTIGFNIPTNYYTIYIGAIDNDVIASQKYQNQFVGIIDELRISKDLWTPQQILEYYDSTK